VAQCGKIQIAFFKNRICSAGLHTGIAVLLTRQEPAILSRESQNVHKNGFLYQGSMLRSQSSAIFTNFLGQKLAFFLKTNVMIHFLHNSSVFCIKNAYFFADFLGKNI
jgi:hypothetical protein